MKFFSLSKGAPIKMLLLFGWLFYVIKYEVVFHLGYNSVFQHTQKLMQLVNE